MNKGGTNGTWDIALAARRANSHHHTSCAFASLTSPRWLGLPEGSFISNAALNERFRCDLTIVAFFAGYRRPSAAP
jgi:hypothetical protein